MKKFIIINGAKAYIIEKPSLRDAGHYAINYMNHSHEVIVREITSTTDYTYKYQNVETGNKKGITLN